MPLMLRLNQTEDHSLQEHIEVCLISLRPIVKQLQIRYLVKKYRRNIQLATSVMRFYHGLLTTDQDVDAINTVVRRLGELNRDARED